MYETVKVVKGYEIKRMKGTRGAYHVNVREGKGFREFHTFRTIKAATEFIETTLQIKPKRGTVPVRSRWQRGRR